MQAYHPSFSAAQAAYSTPAAAAAAAAHYYHQQNHSVAANYAILQSHLQQGAGNGDAAVAAMSGFPYTAASSMGSQPGSQVYGGAGLQVLYFN